MEQDLLFNIPLQDYRPINEMPSNREWTITRNRLIVENAPPKRKIYINYILVSEYDIGDAESERIAIVHMFLNGIGNQQQLAEIWGVHYNTINNYIAAYRRIGFKGLTGLFYEPESRRSELSERKEAFNGDQMSIFESASNDNQLDEETSRPLLNEPSRDKDFLHDEILSTEGTEQKGVENTDEIEQKVIDTKYGGSMLYYPLICEMFDNILNEAKKIEQKLNKNDRLTFGLKKILLTLVFYVFIGILNPEASKSLRRKEFGVLIGERAAPCCKTLRTGLNMLTVDDFPSYINRELKRQYVRLKYVELGTLYVDGHFIPYYGKKNVHKGYSTQRRLAMPGHYQNWANDKNGRPIFFYINNSFVKFTDAIKNAVIDTLELMSETGIKERLIVVFDRGGYDGKLFTELDSIGVGFITWQKGGKGREQSLLTENLSYNNREGKAVTYLSYKDKVKITNYRDDVEAITVYDEATKKQSTFINNLEYVGILDKTDSYKIQLLDGRWAQENFFKDAKVKVDIDEQMGYKFEEDIPEGEDNKYYVINPEWLVLTEEVERLEKKFKLYSIKKGSILSRFQELKRNVSLKCYLRQKSNKKVLKEYDLLKLQLEEKREKLGQIESQVKYSALHDERKDILKTVRSSVILAIKASVYNMRKRFDEMAAQCFKDHRELSKFILALTSSPATITLTDKTCYVKLKKLETPVYQKAAEMLIEKLNAKDSRTTDGNNRKIIFQF